MIDIFNTDLDVLYKWLHSAPEKQAREKYKELLKAGYVLKTTFKQSRMINNLIHQLETKDKFPPSYKALNDLYIIVHSRENKDAILAKHMKSKKLDVKLKVSDASKVKPSDLKLDKGKSSQVIKKMRDTYRGIPPETYKIQKMSPAIKKAIDAGDMIEAARLGAFGKIDLNKFKPEKVQLVSKVTDDSIKLISEVRSDKANLKN